MLKFNGLASSKFPQFFGIISTIRLPFYQRRDIILVTENIDFECIGYKGIITTQEPNDLILFPHMIGNVSLFDIQKMKDGDVVCIGGDGIINIYWEIESQQNSLFLTDACNCFCIMCPQPPNKHDDKHYKNALCVMDMLKHKSLENICITGGEPTFNDEQFIHILKRCNLEHPRAVISILTNAKKFSDEHFTSRVYNISTNNNIFCISIHSDIDLIHDSIVRTKGSYAKTQSGIYNLAKYNIPIEIRYVINKFNYTRIKEFSEHMYRYFPFCDHYVFMALETCGFASENYHKIFVDPIEYKDELRNAVLALKNRSLHVSVYNVPLCLCHPDIRMFARKSISSWKNIFMAACEGCARAEECCGFFATSSDQMGKNILPFLLT
jgi:His-Xaa-Ser system radical SAM maturase HxsC